jgi:hypothetical protein
LVRLGVSTHTAESMPVECDAVLRTNQVLVGIQRPMLLLILSKNHEGLEGTRRKTQGYEKAIEKDFIHLGLLGALRGSNRINQLRK